MGINVGSRERVDISFTLNGDVISGSTTSRLLLSDFIREVLGTTGTHVGCEHGVCGACTVRIDGRAVRSCLTFAIQVRGKSVDTVEGLVKSKKFSILQEAFIENHAIQCGFCAPGILMSLAELLDSEEVPNEKGVRDLLSGHLCRCTGYTAIVKAALAAISKGRALKSVR
tara:strand:- start:175 stop:684 length:510 start_codon:yes stop_codon:yes gene_type:complete